jgi:hypothetical protein
MRRTVLITGLVAIGAGVAWQAAPALQAVIAPKPQAPDSQAPVAAKPPSAAQTFPAKPATPKAEPPVKALTPMAERVATIGLLNKRNGLWRDITMKPGQAVRIGDVVVRLKACETTAPWEQETYTGAFVQLIVLGSDEKWRKVFSGWLYKESPSLNLVEHPIYDVWAKACTMRHPDTGPETTVLRGGEAGSAKPASKARKSAAPAAADDSADDNKAI